MQTVFRTTRKSRELLLPFLENYTMAQLNKIPEGFNNNMFWNIAHIIVTQQRIVYSLSGLPMHITESMANTYKIGTRPERDVTEAEAASLKSLLFTTIAKTEEDYKNGIFKTYREYTTEFGYTLTSAEDAIQFNNYHEGIHFGTILALRKLV